MTVVVFLLQPPHQPVLPVLLLCLILCQLPRLIHNHLFLPQVHFSLTRDVYSSPPVHLRISTYELYKRLLYMEHTYACVVVFLLQLPHQLVLVSLLPLPLLLCLIHHQRLRLIHNHLFLPHKLQVYMHNTLV